MNNTRIFVRLYTRVTRFTGRAARLRECAAARARHARNAVLAGTVRAARRPSYYSGRPRKFAQTVSLERVRRRRRRLSAGPQINANVPCAVSRTPQSVRIRLRIISRAPDVRRVISRPQSLAQTFSFVVVRDGGDAKRVGFFFFCLCFEFRRPAFDTKTKKKLHK